jgi:hypothetical protein
MTLLVLACFLRPSSRDQVLVLVAPAQFHGGRGDSGLIGEKRERQSDTSDRLHDPLELD